ncbi:hypothetical protein [Actinomadura rayongensis]|uniref:Uncharacterized protein n=1 Tax=Actinomadura rayongensis TaxID=1429076 RepID=A0A6I4WHD0_9ACTN|nr:hypothetical protein [Actinomadura rayongensis]MXQ67705.1 hypothetical protein [Actinomadura rayongensis]
MTDPMPSPAVPVLAPPANSPADPPADAPDVGERDAEVAKLRRENAAWRTKLRAAEARVTELEDQTRTEAEKAVAQARAEAARETAAKFARRLRDAEARGAAAALKFRDVGDALRLADLDSIEIGADGEIDTDAVRPRWRRSPKPSPTS